VFSLKDRIIYYLLFPWGHFAADLPGGALFILAPAIGVAWGLTPAQIGFIITAHAIGAGLGYMPSGIMGDRFERRGVVLLFMLGWAAVGYIAASFSWSYGVLILLIAFAGFGDGGWHPAATGTMVQKMPEKRGFALGIHLVGGILAEVIGPVTAGVLLTILDWREVLRLSVIPLIFTFFIFCLTWPKILRAKDTKISLADFASLIKPWKSQQGINMIFVMIFYSMAYIALLAMTPLYLQNDLGYSSVFAGVTFAIMMVTGGLIAPLIGRVSDRFNRKMVNGIALIIGVFGLGLLAFSSLAFFIVVGAALAAGAWTGLRPSLLADAVEITGKRESTSLGIIFVFMDGIGALGAVFAGIVGYADLRYAFLFAGILALLAVICLSFNLFTKHRFPIN
tara:strand:+ start:2185 stop:3366 length:1182 start_codon:yes stop_codon:yes gene_type:complete